MSSILERVFDFMLRHRMLEGSGGAIVAVSGGPDSVAILNILVGLLRGHGDETPRVVRGSTDEMRSHLRIQSPFTITVVHLNHKLRPGASDREAAFVRDLAHRLELPVIVGAADVTAISAELKMGIEEAARAARYSFLCRAARLAGADRIITGHTMNDQVETFIMRAIRGAAMSGLAGMAAVRPVHEPRGLQIAVEPPGLSLTEAEPPHRSEGTPLLIRPALCLTRTDVEQYCRKHSLEFAVDPSNFSSAFTRNRIRQKIVPGLCEIEPNAVRSIARAMELIALDNQVLDGLAKLVLERASQPDEQTRWRHPGYSALEVDVLIGEPQAVVNRAIMLAARRLLPPGNELTSTHVLEVEKLIRMGRSGKHIDLPGGLRVWREGRLIIIDAGRMRRAPYEVELGVGPNGVRAGGFRITLERNKSAAHFDELIVRIRTEKARTGRDWRMAILDDSALPDTLQVRPRRPGERVLVTGQSRSIKLKNLMINHKIPVSRREFWPLAYTRDGRYVWSPGLPPSVDFAANRETRALAFLSATEVERTAELISEEQYG